MKESDCLILAKKIKQVVLYLFFMEAKSGDLRPERTVGSLLRDGM